MPGIERFSKGRPSAKKPPATTVINGDASSSGAASLGRSNNNNNSVIPTSKPFSSGPLAHLSSGKGSFGSFEYGGFGSGDIFGGSGFGDGFGTGFGFGASDSSSRDSTLMPPPASGTGGGIGIFQNRKKTPPVTEKASTGRKVTFQDDSVSIEETSTVDHNPPKVDGTEGLPPFTNGPARRPPSTEGTAASSIITPNTPAASVRPHTQGPFVTPHNQTGEPFGGPGEIPGFEANQNRAPVYTAEQDNNLVSPPMNVGQSAGSYKASSIPTSSGFGTEQHQEHGGANQGISSFRGRKFDPSASNGTTNEFTAQPRLGDAFLTFDGSRQDSFDSAPRRTGDAEGGNSGSNHLRPKESSPALLDGHVGPASDKIGGSFSDPPQPDSQYQTPDVTHGRQGDHHYQTPNPTTCGQRMEASPFEGMDIGDSHTDYYTPYTKPVNPTQGFMTPFHEGQDVHTQTAVGQKEGSVYTSESVARGGNGTNGMMAQTNVASPDAQNEQVSPEALQGYEGSNVSMDDEESSKNQDNIDWEAVHEEISQTTQDCRDILELFDGDLLEANTLLEMANADVLRMQGSTIDQITELLALEAALDDMISDYAK